jgi:hypothetical protein
MRPETLLKNFKTFCVICRRRIPRSRHRRRAITCSAAHQKRLTKLRKIERDHRLCSVCGKPSTPDEKRQFRLFRTSLVTQDASRRSKAKKGILDSAKGNQTLEDFAYVVKETPKRPKRRRRVRGVHGAL